METSWNKLNLQHPPYLTWYTSRDTFDVKVFLATIDKAIRELEAMNILDTEAAFLSRLIYRMKNKFRNDKGLKSMEKVNRALINYLNMNFVQDYKDLQSYVYVKGNGVTLPSRQLLEYVLVRTQGFAKLMERLEQVARYSAHFLKMRIKLGHAWGVSLIAYAVVSRIWILSRQLIRRCCKWYKGLYRYMDKFQYVGLPWIPNNQPLPHDLEQWLSIEWMYNEKMCTSHGKSWDNMILKLLGEHPDSHDAAASIAEHDLMTHNSDDSLRKDTLTCNILGDEPASHADANDIGVVIDRKVFEANVLKACKCDTGIPLARKDKRAHASDNGKLWKRQKTKKKTMKLRQET